MSDINDISMYDRWHIDPIAFPQGDEYLADLTNIEMAATGLLNAMEANRFFDEACQMIANGIKIFRLGLFDAAFYSLRQSIETSIGTLFLMANPKKIKKWNALEKGFESGTMSTFLREKEPVFSEIRTKMGMFFENIRQIQRKTNKYVHKQGYKSFYTTQRLTFPREKVEDIRSQILSDFEETLKISIGAVAVYRLAIDPLPVLLMEDSMMRRSMGFITAPFSDIFVNKYIGKENIDAYKTTQLYTEYKECLLRNEEKNEGTLLLAEWQFVDRKLAGEIVEQIHLLSFYDNLAFALIMVSDKIIHVFVEGVYAYSSDTLCLNNGYTIGTEYYNQFFCVGDYNIKYNKAYISRVSVDDKWSVIEHCSPLSIEEIKIIKDIALQYDGKYRKSVENMKIWAESQGFDFRER